MSNSPKSVAFLITGLAMGGAEAQLVRLALGLKHRGWKVVVVSMTSPTAFVEELRQGEIPVADLRMRAGIPNPQGLVRLAALLHTYRPAILHSHMVHANLLGRFARLLVRIPVQISTAHSINEGGRWRELAYRFSDPFCDLTTHVCQAALDRYIAVRAVPAHKAQLLPNGIDTAAFQPNSEQRERLRRGMGLADHFIWLAAGRLAPEKDYRTMLLAFARVVKHFPRSVLLVAGDGVARKEIEELICELRLGEYVHLLGVRRDVDRLMRLADAFILSSAWEGLPMVLLEAAASGLPVVVTNVGGNAEVVLDGVTGFVVPCRAPDSMASTMQRLLRLPAEERRRMGEAGRAHIIEHYDLELIVSRWELLYEKLLAKKRSTSLNGLFEEHSPGGFGAHPSS